MELKKQIKDNEKTKKKYDKNILIGKSYLNSIENIISKALTDNEIGHEEFKTIMNEEDKYCNLNESARIITSQRSIYLSVYLSIYLSIYIYIYIYIYYIYKNLIDRVFNTTWLILPVSC